MIGYVITRRNAAGKNAHRITDRVDGFTNCVFFGKSDAGEEAFNALFLDAAKKDFRLAKDAKAVGYGKTI
ncbi:MAG: hypothetical protein GY778_05085, partial [bacterium]|nr:hypothetical protein [bacterium]